MISPSGYAPQESAAMLYKILVTQISGLLSVKELILSYFIGETILSTIYIYTAIMVTEFTFLNSNPV